MGRYMKVYVETLGCVRNQVDSEVLAGTLARDGWEVTEEAAAAEAIVVNTCSFIMDAVDSSVDTILALSEHKKTGACRYLVVGGCLPERFQGDIATSLPEVDFFAGAGAYPRIRERLRAILQAKAPAAERIFCPDPMDNPLQTAATPRLRTEPFTAYLKVAEGCSRKCTYCIIPKLRGVQRSRSLEDIVAETRLLVADGVKEIVLVAQETTDWGSDLAPKGNIAGLVDAVCRETAGKAWVRLLYGHPESITEALLEVMARHDHLCPYFDIPIQHAADGVLKKMGRHYRKSDLLDLFSKIREKVPGAVLRTTVIVGFPGETEADVETLLHFVETVRFDHLGVFVYSDMEDLPSHRLPDHVAPEVAAGRYDAVMAAQAEISYANNQKRLDATCEVLVELVPEEGLAEGRTRFQAPEVDGITYVDGENLKPGDVVRITVTDAFDYDLAGDVVA